MLKERLPVKRDTAQMLNRKLIGVAVGVAVVGLIGWTYYHSQVPAIHPDHDHGLENIAGGGFLHVEAVEGGRRNLVGRPGRVLILHWFEVGSSAGGSELPMLVDYAASVAGDPGIEVVMIAMNAKRPSVLSWARNHGVPIQRLYVDPQGKTAALMGVRRVPETLIYDPEGRLAHQARGATDWRAPELRAAIERFKQGGERQR